MARARTRALIAQQLGVRIAVREGGTYRDTTGTPFSGDWIGAFAQPGAILNRVSAISARLVEDGGVIIDEYGESVVASVRRDGDRVELVKKYATQQFNYVGELRDGTLAGYWYAPVHPRFAGVFWLARVDHLSEATVEALSRSVRSTSPRRFLLGIALPAVGAGFVAGVVAYPPLAIAMVGLAALFVSRVGESTRALRTEVEAWKTALG